MITIDNLSKIPCLAPFGSLHIRQNGYSICCSSSFEKRFNSNQINLNIFLFRMLRKTMLNEVNFPSECLSCLRNGIHSKQFETEEMVELSKINLKVMDENYYVSNFKIGILFLDLGRRCNLACRICNSKHSTSYETKIEKSYQKVFGSSSGFNEYSQHDEDLLDLIKQVPKKNIHLLELQGGEPFLSPIFEQVLDQFQPEIKVKIISNGMIHNRQKLNILSKFNEVEIFYSIDGGEGLQEYLRIGSNLERIKNNIKKNSVYVHESFLNITISRYNIFSLKDIFESIQELDKYIHGIEFHFVEDNKSLTIYSLSYEEKRKIVEGLNTYEFSGNFEKEFNKLSEVIQKEIFRKDYCSKTNDLKYDEYNLLIDKENGYI